MAEEDEYIEGGDEFVEEDEFCEETAKELSEKAELATESRAFNFLLNHHPEIRLDYIEEIQQKLALKQLGDDMNHRSVPYLTPFEKTKIIGFRANQLSQGASLLIDIDSDVHKRTDVLDLARMELDQRKLPFILKRPMPDGTFEYWRLQDLLLL